VPDVAVASVLVNTIHNRQNIELKHC
jgi:hypothetical protein